MNGCLKLNRREGRRKVKNEEGDLVVIFISLSILIL